MFFLRRQVINPSHLAYTDRVLSSSSSWACLLTTHLPRLRVWLVVDVGGGGCGGCGSSDGGGVGVSLVVVRKAMTASVYVFVWES